MAESATLNVRMDTDTKEEYLLFCDEVGVSASSLMNMFAKYVVRNQRVPFSLSSKPDHRISGRFARLFPADEFELDDMLTEAEEPAGGSLVSAKEGFELFERRMGW